MDKVGIFVDGANIFYGLKGKRIDFKHFLAWLAEGREIAEASYFNAWQKEDSKMQKFFQHVRDSGWKLYVKQTTKNSITKEWKQAGVDVYLSVKAIRFSKNFDTFILVAGDYDYMPLIDEMVRWEKKIEVVSFDYCLHPIYKRWKVRYLDDYVAAHAVKNKNEKTI